MSEWTPDIGRLQAFDDAEWMEVERTFCGRLLAYVARRVADPQAREDILQETLLGSVRGIAAFDPLYTFEQYLFGICHNRTIDHLRRTKVHTLQEGADEDGHPGLETLAEFEETPSRIVGGRDLARRGRVLLAEVLRDWVQETWGQGEFTRLMVIEALFSGGWRNKDAWRRFELRDETAVAGVKFRALKRLRELARERDPDGSVLAGIAAETEEGERLLDFSVPEVWREQRVSCPARYWLGRMVLGSLPEGPEAFLRFHLDEMSCPICGANLEDLRRIEEDPELQPLLERVRATTLAFLRSRVEEGET